MEEVKGSWTVALLKPEIATGFYDFRSALESVGSSTLSASPSATAVVAADGATTAAAATAGANAAENAVSMEQQQLQQQQLCLEQQRERAVMFPDSQLVRLCLERIRKEGFQIRSQQMHQLSRAQARNLLRRQCTENQSDDFQRRLQLLCRGPSLVLLLFLPLSSHANITAVDFWKQLMGPDDPREPRKQLQSNQTPPDQWPLRALCGLNGYENALDGSENMACAYRDMMTFFPQVHAPLSGAAILLTQDLIQRVPTVKELLVATFDLHGIMVLDSKEIQVESTEEREVLHECDRMEADQTFHDLKAHPKSWMLLIEGIDVINKLRVLLGPASVSQAIMFFPDSLRARFARCLQRENAGALADDLVVDGMLVYSAPKQVQWIRKTWFASSNVVQKTFAIIKPDVASCRSTVTEIQNAMVNFGFAIEAQRHLHLTKEQAQEFYGEHFGKAFFERLIQFMTSGPIIVLCLRRRQAITGWRKLMGPTNSLKARETHPWTLRARFGTDGTQNATHGSDSPISAAREIGIFFPDIARGFHPLTSIRPLVTQPLRLPYQDTTTLESVLSEALCRLCQECPGSSKQEACFWLGNFLLHKKADLEQELHAQTARTGTNNQATACAKPGKSLAQPSDKPSPLINAHPLKMIVLNYEEQYAQTAKEIQDAIETKFKYSTVINVNDLLNTSETLNDAIAKLDQVLNCADSTGRFLLTQFPLENITFCALFRQKFSAAEVAFEVTNRHGIDRFLPNTLAINHQVVMSLHGGVPLDRVLQRVASRLESVLVLVDDPSACLSFDQWTQLGHAFGFGSIGFHEMLQAKVESERNPLGEATRLVRSGAQLPDDLLHDWVVEAVEHRQRIQNQYKFLLVGFPWQQISPTRLERSCGGRCHCFVSVEVPKTSFLVPVPPQDDQKLDKWQQWYQQQGIWSKIDVTIDTNKENNSTQVIQSVSDLLRPVVGFCISSSGEIPCQVQEIAHRRGFTWIKVQDLASSASSSGSPPPQVVVRRLEQLLLHPSRGPRKIILEGFPRSHEDVVAFQKSRLARPDYVLQLGHQLDSNQFHALQPLDHDTSIPKLVVDPTGQDNHAESKYALLKSFLWSKQVTFLVGDHHTLNLDDLQRVLVTSGSKAHVLDATRSSSKEQDHNETSSDVQLTQLLPRLERCLAGHCVVVGAPESTDFMQAFLQECGHAIQRVLVLRQLPIQKPKTKEEEEEERDLYSDEEEAEQARAVQDLARIRPALRQLMAFFQTKRPDNTLPSRLELVAIPFVDAQRQRVAQQIVRWLRPTIVGVVASAWSGYKAELRKCANQLGIGILDAQELFDHQVMPSESAPALQQMLSLLGQRMVRHQGFFTCFLLDGFPRSSSMQRAPYVAEQLMQLERQLGDMKLLIKWQVQWSNEIHQRPPLEVSTEGMEAQQDRELIETSDFLEFWHKHQRVFKEIQEDPHVSMQQQLVDTLRALS